MITLLLLVRATYMYGVVLYAHPVRGESHNQRNTTREVATQSTAPVIFCWLYTNMGLSKVGNVYTSPGPWLTPGSLSCGCTQQDLPSQPFLDNLVMWLDHRS